MQHIKYETCNMQHYVYNSHTHELMDYLRLKEEEAED